MPKLLLLSICCAILLTFDVIDAQSFRQLRKVHITKCAKAKSLEERGLCSAVMSPFDRQDAVTYREFEVTSRNFDLNGDGRPETIAWISSLGGTSGQPLFVLSKSGGRYRTLWSADLTWTPVVLLRTTSRGWHDFAFLVAGGGVVAHFVIVRNNGKSYKDFRTVEKRPKGETLIDQTWRWSTFGPTK